MNQNEMIAGYVGTDPVEKIYLGSELVWQNTPPVPIDYTQQYLTHEYVSGNGISQSEAGSVSYTKVYLLDGYVSFDDGNTWMYAENLRMELYGNPNRYVPDGLTTSQAQALSPTTNRRTMLKGSLFTFWGCDENNVSVVQSGWSYKVYGNILSLYYGDNFSGQTEFPAGASIKNLFANPYVNDPNESRNIFCIDASNLILTPRHLTAGCYENLFSGQASVSAVTCLATDISATDCTKNWLAGVSPTGVFYKHPSMHLGNWTRGDSGIPTGWTVQDYPIDREYQYEYFTIEAISAGTINFAKEVDAVPDVVLDYSMDDGVSWTTFTSTTAGTQIQVAAGDKVLFKGINSGTGAYVSPTIGTRGNTFSGTTATIKAYGNVMSLLYGDGFYSATTFQSGVDRVLGGLFRNTTALTDASNLVLPVMDFSDNTGCYAHMFLGCTSLTGVPALPATGLSESCYADMFEECTSLTVAPELPATTLAGDCYFRMFMGCTSLVTPPELPALTTVGECYYLMFAGCTSLTDSPVLPAATVVAGGSASLAYAMMFSGCTSLTAITCLATTIEVYNPNAWVKQYGTQNWVSGVAASGTFYKDPNMAGWTTGVNGIPSGWTVQDYTPPA